MEKFGDDLPYFFFLLSVQPLFLQLLPAVVEKLWFSTVVSFQLVSSCWFSRRFSGRFSVRFGFKPSPS